MYNIYHNLIIDTPISKVFDFVTRPEYLNKWWTKKCSGQPQIDFEYMFWFAPEFDWRARVINLESDHLITYQFIRADDDWTDTMLTFKLDEIESDQTRLNLFHKNWVQENLHFGRTSYCWAQYLTVLKEHVEQMK